MILNKILKLGHPKLYEHSSEVLPSEVVSLASKIDELNNLILEFRKVYNAGRAIAAPQIGLMKRIICMNIDCFLDLKNCLLLCKYSKSIFILMYFFLKKVHKNIILNPFWIEYKLLFV